MVYCAFMIQQFWPTVLLASSLAFPAATGRAAEFVVLDQKAPEELSETTRLYVDGSLVATVRLDGNTSEARIPVLVPDAGGPSGHTHDYALCGEIVFRNRAGAREIHQVSGQGILSNPTGHTFLALGARDFTQFYLADPNDPAAAQSRFGRSPFCQTPVS
jgi:hypothetical protein